MLRNRDGYGPDGRRRLYLDMGGDAPAAPDYTPVAQASEAAARIAAEQGDRVLAESTRQYERNMEVAQPIIDAQARMMKSAADQGDEYYSYWKSRAQPVEDALNADAMKAGSPAEQEAAAGRAMADVRAGTAQQQNQMIRQGMRYGWSPAKVAAAMGAQGTANASMIASASNQAREREKALGTAKKLDVAGLYRGMPGASQGAYTAATNSGNSAVGNSTAVGQGMTNGAIASAGIVNQGQATRLSGLNGILSSQTSIYNNSQGNDGFGALLGGLGGIGQGLGAMGMKFGPAAALSDRRMKENIVRVGEDPRGFGLYEFNYLGGEQRYRGVMADEIEPIMPDAVVYDDLGFASVNYPMIGVEMEAV